MVLRVHELNERQPGVRKNSAEGIDRPVAAFRCVREQSDLPVIDLRLDSRRHLNADHIGAFGPADTPLPGEPLETLIAHRQPLTLPYNLKGGLGFNFLACVMYERLEFLLVGRKRLMGTPRPPAFRYDVLDG